jgi:peptide/nickel transport system ATP-binding protein
VEQLLVMYGGTVVESGMTEAVFARRAHPYTRGLFAARPQLQAAPAAGHLPTIAGAVPELVDLPAGCPFAGRCPHTRDDCYVQPPPARTLHQPSMAAPASLAFWRQPHVARCLYEQVLTQGAKA